ncbi:MAG: response regulator [Pseudomonadota bacterium]
MAEDDDDDFMLTKEAFEESRLLNTVYRVKDGVELMDYLFHRGSYKNEKDFPRPSLILLDLNMPRKDGREALKEIKADSGLSSIPVIVLTTAKGEEDMLKAYRSGVNSYIRKPVSFDEFVKAMSMLHKYWFEVVELPE